MIHSDRSLFDWARQNKGRISITEEDAEYIEAGPLYDGVPVVCPQRWAFWESRLVELGKKKSGLKEETRNTMLEAAGSMTRIERSISITS